MSCGELRSNSEGAGLLAFFILEDLESDAIILYTLECAA